MSQELIKDLIEKYGEDAVLDLAIMAKNNSALKFVEIYYSRCQPKSVDSLLTRFKNARMIQLALIEFGKRKTK